MGLLQETKNQLISFLLQKPRKFDADQEEFRKIENAVEEGHIFALFPSRKNVEDSGEIRRESHFRVKKNIGSRLASFQEKTKGKREIELRYVGGDICYGDATYESVINLVCDKAFESFRQMQTDKCTFGFTWHTPLACSQCKFDEASKRIVFLLII